MNQGQRIFGTDGIRGRFGEGWLSTDAVSALGRAVGKVLGSQGSKRALVGHDGRASGPTLAAALGRGLGAEDVTTVSAGLITTPGLAWVGRQGDYALTAMISASHNPASDNGIKLFGPGGEKLADDLELEVERELLADRSAVTVGDAPAEDAALAATFGDALRQSFADLRLDGHRIALDCANGGGSHLAPAILRDLGAEVEAIGCEPDGTNINADCGSTHPERLIELVRTSGAELGIALDGDGDRCILVDENGALVDGDPILTLVARHAVRHQRWSDKRIVATVMSNRGLHKALREVGVQVETVGVGDRQVVDALRKDALPLGGEQSGHIVFGADNAYTGDGLYTALRVLEILVHEGERLSALAAPFQAFPQVLINVPVARKPSLSDFPSVTRAVQAIESALGEDGRVLLRYSGTEPLARVMVEGPDAAWIREQAESLAAVLSEEIGA